MGDGSLEGCCHANSSSRHGGVPVDEHSGTNALAVVTNPGLEGLSAARLRKFAQDAAGEVCQKLEHELRISQREEKATCLSSVLLAMLWEQMHSACDDPAFVAVVRETSRAPAKSLGGCSDVKGDRDCIPSGDGRDAGSGHESCQTVGASLSFAADLRRPSHEWRFGVGLRDVVSPEGDVLLVMGLDPNGIVQAWNNHCASSWMPWRRVQLYTAVISVNGVSGDCLRMRRELKTCRNAVLVACSPPCLRNAADLVHACRSAAPLPERLAFWAAYRALSTPRTGQIYV